LITSAEPGITIDVADPQKHTKILPAMPRKNSPKIQNFTFASNETDIPLWTGRAFPPMNSTLFGIVIVFNDGHSENTSSSIHFNSDGDSKTTDFSDQQS
jgi:hypothetical protein